MRNVYYCNTMQNPIFQKTRSNKELFQLPDLTRLTDVRWKRELSSAWLWQIIFVWLSEESNFITNLANFKIVWHSFVNEDTGPTNSSMEDRARSQFDTKATERLKNNYFCINEVFTEQFCKNTDFLDFRQKTNFFMSSSSALLRSEPITCQV